jgi:antitoxin ParD1/3/4
MAISLKDHGSSTAPLYLCSPLWLDALGIAWPSPVGNGLTTPANRAKMSLSEVLPMETMNIALPDSMKQFVQERVTEGGYSSVSEYVRELIRADQKRKSEERIDALLLEGIDSGEPIPMTEEYWEAKKRKLTERLGKALGHRQ